MAAGVRELAGRVSPWPCGWSTTGEVPENATGRESIRESLDARRGREIQREMD
jgi:hypothetical protein